MPVNIQLGEAGGQHHPVVKDVDAQINLNTDLTQKLTEMEDTGRSKEITDILKNIKRVDAQPMQKIF